MIYEPNPEKCCAHCEQWKPTLDFYWRKERHTHTSWCKSCVNERSVQSRKAEPEKARAACRRSHAKYKAQRNEYSRQYGKRHRKQIGIREKTYAAKKQKYRKTHSELLKQRAKKWSKEHPDNVKAEKLRYRARKKELPDTLIKTEVSFCLNYWNNSCAVCGRKRELWHTIALDHWTPVNRGGGSVAENIVPLCHGLDGCNNSKCDRDPYEWLKWKFGARKAKTIARRIQDYFDHLKSC